MHAPNNFSVIKDLAEELLSKEEYNEYFPKEGDNKSIENMQASVLAKMLDKINNIFILIFKRAIGTDDKNIYKNGKTARQYIEYLFDARGDSPIAKIMWNRFGNRLGDSEGNGVIKFNGPPPYPKCVSCVEHGHTKIKSEYLEKQKGYDNDLGKKTVNGDNHYEGEYTSNVHYI